MRPLRLRSVPLVLIILTVLVMTLPIQASPEQAEVEVRIRTVNLNQEPLAGVTVEVYNATTAPEPLIKEGVTNQTGWVRFQLTNGTYYSFKAFWMDVEVGSLSKQHITSNTTIEDFQCSLAHIEVMVTDEAEVPLPYVDVVLAYTYLTRYNEAVPETDSFETLENGTIVALNMLTNANYTIEAQRYGSLFNRTQIPSLNQLLKEGWANITITCPTYTLFTHVLDSSERPLPNMEVEVYEWGTRMLVQSGTTNDRGSAAFNCTFGRYKVVVYGYSAELPVPRVVLNETVVDLIEDRSFLLIHCKIFNIAPSVAVIDYFGQPMPNVVVRVERKFEQGYVQIANLTTGSDGAVSMPKIGGDYRISVYVVRDLCETRTLHLDETKALFFKVDKYAMVGGHPIETGRLIAYISLILLIALLGIALSYRRLWQIIIRKKSPSQKTTRIEKVYNTRCFLAIQ